METERMKEEQRELSEQVVLDDGFGDIDLVAGVDQAFPDGDALTCIVVCYADSLDVVESVYGVEEDPEPYVPGLLSYRELPSIRDAFAALEHDPDLVLIDGNGYLHMRRLGLASHAGVALDVPTVGVAKNLLVGEVEAGDFPKAVRDEGELLGYEVRTKEGCNPVYVSPGHRVSHETSVELVERFVDGHKLPEPIFLADKRVGEEAKRRKE